MVNPATGRLSWLRLAVASAVLVLPPLLAASCTFGNSNDGEEAQVAWAKRIESIEDARNISRSITQLEVVDAGDEVLRAIPENRRIKTLWVLGCDCTDSALNDLIARLPSLEEIMLYRNTKMEGNLPSLATLNGLLHLDVTHEKTLRSAFFDTVANCQSLEMLRVSSRSVTAGNIEKLAQSKTIRHLYLGRFGKLSLDDIRAAAAGFPSLVILDLGASTASFDQVVAALEKKWPTLEGLAVRPNDGVVEGLEALSSFESLTYFEMRTDTAFTTESARSLARIGSLEAIVLKAPVRANLLGLLETLSSVEEIELRKVEVTSIADDEAGEGDRVKLPPERSLRYLHVTFTDRVGYSTVARLAEVMVKGSLSVAPVSLEEGDAARLAKRFPDLEIEVFRQ